MMAKEKFTKKKRKAKNPGMKRTKKLERRSARRVRELSKKQSKKLRQATRLNKFKIARMKRGVLKSIRREGKIAARIVKHAAHKYGFHTHKAIHFNKHARRHVVTVRDPAQAEIVKDTEAAYSAGSAHKAAATAANRVMAEAEEETPHMNLVIPFPEGTKPEDLFLTQVEN